MEIHFLTCLHFTGIHLFTLEIICFAIYFFPALKLFDDLFSNKHVKDWDLSTFLSDQFALIIMNEKGKMPRSRECMEMTRVFLMFRSLLLISKLLFYSLYMG